jgi:hypothetical protein
VTQAEPGQRVGHRRHGGTGTIKSVISHIALVHWDDGRKTVHNASSLYEKGKFGCSVLAVALIVLPASFALLQQNLWA